MPEQYRKPSLGAIGFDFEAARLAQSETCLALTHKDVLGIVQSALDELGPQSPELIAIKREVFAEVVNGKLAHALRTAIIAAGKLGALDQPAPE
jgi:hypothetical protein